jgi:hypothetical protein
MSANLLIKDLRLVYRYRSWRIRMSVTKADIVEKVYKEAGFSKKEAVI